MKYRYILCGNETTHKSRYALYLQLKEREMLNKLGGEHIRKLRKRAEFNKHNKVNKGDITWKKK